MKAPDLAVTISMLFLIVLLYLTTIVVTYLCDVRISQFVYKTDASIKGISLDISYVHTIIIRSLGIYYTHFDYVLHLFLILVTQSTEILSVSC